MERKNRVAVDWSPLNRFEIGARTCRQNAKEVTLVRDRGPFCTVEKAGVQGERTRELSLRSIRANIVMPKSYSVLLSYSERPGHSVVSAFRISSCNSHIL